MYRHPTIILFLNPRKKGAKIARLLENSIPENGFFQNILQITPRTFGRKITMPTRKEASAATNTAPAITSFATFAYG